MRKQLQDNMLEFIDVTQQTLEGFKTNRAVNLKNKEQVALIDRHMTLLAEEKKKVLQRELVIAVVGTMKAGKSTTINSIVGTEILPNRNEAMTSLPTLITHVKGQVEPKLFFPCPGPVNQLIRQLFTRISEVNSHETLQRRHNVSLRGGNGRSSESHKESGPTLTRQTFEALKPRFFDILRRIEMQENFKTEYTGQGEIFEFLKVLNDLVRLSSSVGVAFPYGAYTSVDTLPRIEVEFSTLENDNGCDDRLTLLDTPGPNEAGQEHFKPMLDEQLKRSSAVMTIIDYTQLNSTSEHELRQTVLSLKDSFASVGESIPIYAIVNKFDNKDQHSLDAEGVKRRVGVELFEGAIPPEHVLPYCARDAFRANLGLKTLRQGGSLDTSLPWVQDLKGNMGNRLWDHLLSSEALMKGHFEDALDASLFTTVIQTCVIENYHNVLPQVLQSALNKALIALEEIRQPLNVLSQSIDTDVEQLREATEQVKKNLEEFERVRAHFDSALQVKMDRVNVKVKKVISDETRLINAEWQGFKGTVIENYADKTFESKSVVETINNGVSNSAVIAIKDMRRKACRRIEESFDDIKDELVEYTRDNVDTVKDKIFDDLKDSGIDATGWKPSLTQVKLDDPGEVSFSSAVKTKDVPVVKRRRQTGLWGMVCEIFDTEEFGWEEYTHCNQVYSVDYQKLLGQFDKMVHAIPQDLSREASDIFEIDIKQSFQEYLNVIADRINQIYDNMTKSMELNQGEAETCLQVKTEISAMTGDIHRCLEKADAIKDGLKTL